MAEPSATPGPPGTVPVREVVPDDAPAIAAVHVVSWQKGQAGLRSAVFLAGLSVEDRARHWAVTIDATSRDHLVVVEVEVGGGVAGFAHVGPSRDEYAGPATGELYTLDVTPHAWGGVGHRPGPPLRGVGAAGSRRLCRGHAVVPRHQPSGPHLPRAKGLVADCRRANPGVRGS